MTPDLAEILVTAGILILTAVAVAGVIVIWHAYMQRPGDPFPEDKPVTNLYPVFREAEKRKADRP